VQPNWKPLEDKLGFARCAGFMYIGRVNGINLYKHGIARLYLALDDRGQCFVQRNSRYERAEFEAELSKIEAALTQLGETLASPYDEAYIARKQEALRRAGIPLLTIQIDPKNRTVI
jgi:hypothetical protein